MRRALLTARSREKATIQALNQQRQRLVRVVAAGHFSEDEIAAEVTQINQKMANAEREADRVSTLLDHQEVVVGEWQRRVSQLQQWTTLTHEEQRTLLSHIVERVEVDATGAIVALTCGTMWEQLLLPAR
jgi:chromosome segregation ATPase